jgi:hypothetical protein
MLPHLYNVGENTLMAILAVNQYAHREKKL